MLLRQTMLLIAYIRMNTKVVHAITILHNACKHSSEKNPGQTANNRFNSLQKQ